MRLRRADQKKKEISEKNVRSVPEARMCEEHISTIE